MAMLGSTTFIEVVTNRFGDIFSRDQLVIIFPFIRGRKLSHIIGHEIF